MEKKSYNWMNQSGLMDLDDMEVIETFNLDPSLAYTSGINQAALKESKRQAFEGYMDTGYTQEESVELANKDNQAILNVIKQHEKRIGKKLI